MRRVMWMSILLCMASLQGMPVKSNCGGRSIGGMTAAGVSAKDYVQDGLVSMFDAIENIGWGVHDGESVNWVDLMDGIAYHIDALQWNWEKNACALYNAAFYVDKTEVLLDAVKAGTFTVEVATSTSLGDAGWNAQTINIAPSVSVGYNLGICALMRKEDTGLVASLYVGTASYSAAGQYTPSNKDALLTTTLLYNGSRGWFFVDGQKKDKTGSAITPNPSLEGVFLRIPSRSYPFRGFYHCFRVYNRTLTDAEIAHNAEIDKIRFKSE